MTIRFRRVMAGLLIVCMGGLTAPLPALAGIVGTDTVAAGAERERLASLLERGDVRARLESLGVDATHAKARVAALSDTEAAQLAAQMDELPAGGHAVGHRQAKEPTRARVMTSFDPLPEDPAFGVGQVPIHALGGGRDPTLDHQIG